MFDSPLENHMRSSKLLPTTSRRGKGRAGRWGKDREREEESEGEEKGGYVQ